MYTRAGALALTALAALPEDPGSIPHALMEAHNPVTSVTGPDAVF